MFERFTDRARLAVVQAQEEARTLDHAYVGPEHLLLGLAHESTGGTAARALESLGIGPEAVRQRVQEHTLLGLIRAGDCVAAQVLTGLGADLDRAHEQVIRVLDQHQRDLSTRS
jgi:ATP-dependent Clp protease ATP-binding subunit ClpC